VRLGLNVGKKGAAENEPSAASQLTPFDSITIVISRSLKIL
jgi:hypothetical protein